MTWIYDFDHPHDRPPRELADLLGGKGANLAEMTTVLGLPVPPGFTITTEACRRYLVSGWPEGLDEELDRHLSRLEERMGRRLGDEADPLLVSVRSGAAVSMPGMMDTVLNLGLNDRSVEGLAAATGDERFAYDSYRRFIAMFSTVVLGLDGSEFERRLASARDLAGVTADHRIPAELLRYLCTTSLRIVADRTGEPFPQDPRRQLRMAVEAVFRSWNTPRAASYRAREGIPDDLGTAVNVQAMVFGNRDDRSATGVGFTRDPSTGAQGEYGDFLINAQGEDVVAGIRNTLPLSAMAEHFGDLHDELLGYFEVLERHYRDMCDVEFTIEQGKLWILQTRIGKRTGAAALKIAVDMTKDRHIRLTHAEAVARVRPEHLSQVLHPHFTDGERDVIATGLPASPGAAVGRVYFTAEDAVAAADRGEKVILVRPETSPDDVAGMAAAEGILTTRGGLVSHAAVVARGWGKPAVCGAADIEIGDGWFRAGDVVVREGEIISIDGTTGEVIAGSVALAAGDVPPEMDQILRWADRIRKGHLGVRANADTVEDATRARRFGAEGIGLCRTEHMFLGDRLPLVQRMILATDPDEEARALEELGDAQRADFTGILEAMDGLPVTVRLLDPPLHEFLPDVAELEVRDAKGDLDEHGRRLLEAARAWTEQNPMLGIRGVRLGILKENLYRVQVRALMEAAVARAVAGGRPRPEIMIPLVSDPAELELVRGWVTATVDDVLEGAPAGIRRRIPVKVGTMIETPRAALLADRVAAHADFFSFGTNDLTQMTWGLSRDDTEGRLLTQYLDRGILARNPFETLDADGVGLLVRRATAEGRAANGDLTVGVCGEHGGDPDSIATLLAAGVDYVSASPFRVPIARLAAAHAVLGT